MDQKDPTQYWASLTDTAFLDQAHKRIEEYYDDLRNTGLYYVWEKSYRAYYGSRLSGSRFSGQLFDSSELSRSGKEGEITNLKTNHYRNLLQHTLQLTTSQRPALSCQATNSDYKSQAQTILGKGIVDYYMREKKVKKYVHQAVETGLVFSEGWVHMPWNATEGEIYDHQPETGAPIYEGDLEFSCLSPLDIPREIDLTQDDDHDWLFVRTRINKFDLAAKYPEKASEILENVNSDQNKYEQYDSFNLQIRRGDSPDSDRAVMWTMYHRKTESMPEGRMTMFTGNTVLFDGPIPYRQIPLYRFAPENLMETPYGYSPAFDLLGPQEALDILTSAVMTNNAASAVQNFWTERGDTVTVNDLGGGLKHLQSATKPESVQLTQSAPETYEFRQQLIGEMETLSGISATVRGNPEASLKSGASLALVVSQSVQFASLIEESLNSLVEDVGTSIINHLRDFGNTPRVANIIGESNRPYHKEFTGDDLSAINRVVIEAASPMSKTVAGRLQIADSLMEKGMIETPKQYITVLTTGQIDPLYEGIQHELLNVRSENEDIREGRPVVAVITDHHADHIREHKTLLADPEARRNPQFVQSVLAHIQEHLNQWRGADPAILMITGQQPPPPPPMMGPPMGPPPPQGPNGPQNGPPPPQGGSPAPVMEPGNPLEGQMPNQPNMPNMPKNSPPEAIEAYQNIEGPDDVA